MKKKTDVKKDDDLSKLINEHGTKMGHIITEIRKMIKETDDQAIIFSQWDSLLQKISGTLIANGIKISQCRGNVMSKNKAVREFNNNKTCRVIMLSSDNAASGLNLTKASRVYMMDPVYGNEEFRISTEVQAVGRVNRLGQKKPVQVFRYLIKDTVEADIFKESYKTSLNTALNKILLDDQEK